MSGLVIGQVCKNFDAIAGRQLRKKQDDVLAEPLWLRELNAPTSLAELEVRRNPEWEEEDRAGLPDNAEEVAAMDSDRVAQQLRAWMKEG